MQFFLDTANLEKIQKFQKWGIIDGVTTNPSLIAKENTDLKTRIQAIAKIIDGPISTEVLSTDTDSMLKEARQYSKWAKNIVIKIPMTLEGIKAVKILTKEKIKTNVTLVFSLPQSIIAAKAGATYISPFVGRLDEILEDGMSLIKDIAQTFQNYNFNTKIIVASIRNTAHVSLSALIGADIATVPPNILEQLIKHPLTDKGIQKFQKDWEESQKNVTI